MSTTFRPYSESEALRSDRSAGDRKRHREKLRRSIRENIADVIAEESIIGRDRDRVIKVPIRGVKEYRFVYGDNAGGVGSGDGNTEPGQVVGSARGKGDRGPNCATSPLHEHKDPPETEDGHRPLEHNSRQKQSSNMLTQAQVQDPTLVTPNSGCLNELLNSGIAALGLSTAAVYGIVALYSIARSWLSSLDSEWILITGFLAGTVSCILAILARKYPKQFLISAAVALGTAAAAITALKLS